jgi:hypothetical protein
MICEARWDRVLKKVTKKKLGESRNFHTSGKNIGDGTKMFKVINK